MESKSTDHNRGRGNNPPHGKEHMDVDMQKKKEEHTEVVKHSPKFAKMSDRSTFNSAVDAYKKDMSMHESTLKHALGNMCIDFDIQCDYN